MAITYRCRYCGTQIGQLRQGIFHWHDLGFDQLSAAERHDMLSYDENGDVRVEAVCEDCQEALERNPEYHELHSFIQ